jgi:hypothetical protein
MRYVVLLLSALFAGSASAYTIIAYSDVNCQQNARTIAPAGTADQRAWSLTDTLSLKLIPIANTIKKYVAP